MRRRDVLKKGCGCGCLAALTLGDGKAFAAEEQTMENDKENRVQQFAQRWVGDVLRGLDEMVDQKTKEAILENCGRSCARDHLLKEAQKCRGDLNKWLEMFNSWNGVEARYVSENEVSVAYRFSDSGRCFCPIAGENAPEVPGSLCNCSRGWLMEVFDTVTGKPTRVEVLETIKRGGEACRFRIEV